MLHTIRLDEVKPEEISGFIKDHFGEVAARQMPARYRGATSKDELNDVVTDGVYACGTRRVANILASRGVPVFVYELTHALDAEGPHALGATHSVDLFFVFGNEDRVEFSERELIRDEWMWSSGASPGAIPKHLRRLREDIRRFVLPPRRPQRAFPRAVKIKMSNYSRKRPKGMLQATAGGRR